MPKQKVTGYLLPGRNSVSLRSIQKNVQNGTDTKTLGRQMDGRKT